MKRAGPRVLWILAGRDNLADSRKFGQHWFNGYRAEFSSERLRVFPLGEFSVEEVKDYFKWRVPERPLDDESGLAFHQATLGIPLAVREAAAIWKNNVALADIAGNVPPRAPREQIVKVMTERFLLHCFDDPQHPHDRAWLYALALSYRPEAQALAAMMQSEDLERDLSELERRHSFVFVSAMKLHDGVQTFLREYLLHDLRRNSKEVRSLHERAIAYLETQRQARETKAETLENCVADERWTAAMLSLTHHRFWLDEDQGWATLLPAFTGGLAYDEKFSRSLVEVAESFAGTLMQRGKRRLEALRNGLPKQDNPEHIAALLQEVEASARWWPSDKMVAERSIILILQRGRLAFHRKQYAEALKHYEQLEQTLSADTEGLKKKLGIALDQVAGRLLWPEGQIDAVYSAEAEAILQKVVSWLPERQGAWYSLGAVFYKAGKSDKAILAWKRAIELDSKFAHPHNGLGNVYYDLKHHDEVIAEYQRAIELDPKYASPHNGLGNVYRDLKRHEEAIAEYQRAIELDPKWATPHNGLGNVYSDLKRHDEAIAEYQRAIELDPKWARPHDNLGDVYRDLKRHDEAIAEYQRAIELDPKRTAPHSNLGIVFRRTQKLEEALLEFQQAIELAPQEVTYHASLANCYRQLGREAEATTQTQIVHELLKDKNEYNRACCAALLSEIEEALPLLETALGQNQVALEWARRDPDFDFIRDDPRFKTLVRE